MLRRRHKTPKTPAREARAPRPAEATGGRRRARSGAYVPPELLLKGGAKHEKHDTPPPAIPEGVAHRKGEVVLVTGFEPFGGETSNPSWDICAKLGSEIAGMRVETCRVPCLGQAGGRTHMGVERIAINVDDARMPDNRGAVPVDETIAANGPPAYFATVPIKAMAAAMRAAGAPTEVSNSAGTYVCNHLMYGVLHYIAASGHRARAGFIHVPYSEPQALDKRGEPSMSLATMVNGVRAAIAAAREHRQDLKVAEGTLD